MASLRSFVFLYGMYGLLFAPGATLLGLYVYGVNYFPPLTTPKISDRSADSHSPFQD
jgi:hypothetical protein